jgi:hypothetical protein
MSAPKHLWAGDWETESEAAKAARAGSAPIALPRAPVVPIPAPRAPARPAPPPPPRPAPPPPAPRGEPSPRLPPRIGAWRARAALALRRARTRAVLIAAVLVAALAVGLALGLGGGGGGNRTVALARVPYLGVQMVSLPGGAVLVQGVVPGSPAAAAGLGSGDVIVALDGHKVASPGDVDAQLAGERARLRILRGGVYLTVGVRLGRASAGAP